MSNLAGELCEICERLQRDVSARGVAVLNEEGEILGYAGALGRMPEKSIDAVADLVTDVVSGMARRELIDGDDLVAEIDVLHACAAPLSNRAILVVIFDERSNLSLVRLRMKRLRDLILRSLEAR